jgi:hypothetical protein
MPMNDIKIMSLYGPLDEDLIEDKVPDLPGIYIWRATPFPPDTLDVDGFMDWIERLLEGPYLDSGPAKIVSPSVSRVVRDGMITFESVQFHGGRLNLKDTETLRDLVVDRKFRMRVKKVITDLLKSHGSVVYVGQSDKLRVRIKEHLREGSSLERRLVALKLNIRLDMSISFAALPNLVDGVSEGSERKKEITILEQVVTRMLLSPLSIKAG